MLPTMGYGLCSGCDVESHLTFSLILLICKLQTKEFIQNVVGKNPWKEAVCAETAVWTEAGVLQDHRLIPLYQPSIRALHRHS